MVREVLQKLTTQFFDTKAGEVSTSSKNIQELFANLASEVGVKVNVVIDDETKEAMFSGPTIIVANHASFPLVIFDFLKNTHQRVGLFVNEIYKRILPIKSERLRRNLLGVNLKKHNYLSPGGLAEIIFPNRISEESRKLENGRSAVEAVRILTEGGIVVIFPTGGLQDEWFSGVGSLINSANKRSIDVNIVFANIKGTTFMDTLRFIAPGVSRRINNPVATVNYKLFQASSFFHNLNNSEISSKLQHFYDSWLKES